MYVHMHMHVSLQITNSNILACIDAYTHKLGPIQKDPPKSLALIHSEIYANVWSLHLSGHKVKKFKGIFNIKFI